MKRLGTIVGAGVLLVFGTACANPQNDQLDIDPGATPPANSQPSETPDRQPARTPPAGGTAVPEGQLDDSALPRGYPRMVWTQEEGRTLGAVAQEGGCGKASIEVTEQTDRQIVLILVETQPATPQACTMDLRYPKLTTELDAPLGDRTVVLRAEQRKK